MSAITYDELARVLADAGSGIEAAEAHGCLSGALCAERDFKASEWALELLPESDASAWPAGTLEVLEQALSDAREALSGDDLSFEPLLPHDGVAIRERVLALAAWCSGFLYGIGRSGGPRTLPGDLVEISGDFAEISRAALGHEEGGEESERDYAELVEFVRASVQLAWEELRARRAHDAGAPSRPH
ncbi:MAG: UPF0149 family protein [Steroidobacteraceae bacterium]|nr:UPF0149 family protein [Steroidobacteraceae bacterium]